MYLIGEDKFKRQRQLDTMESGEDIYTFAFLEKTHWFSVYTTQIHYRHFFTSENSEHGLDFEPWTSRFTVQRSLPDLKQIDFLKKHKWGIHE